MHIRLLMIDDEPAILSSLGDIFAYLSTDELHPNTYTIQQAANGVEGLQKVKNQEVDFNVILSDIKMPKMDGVTMLEKLVKLKPHIPVILYSGHTMPKNNYKFVELGAYAAFSSPPDLKFLIALVDEAGEWNYQQIKKKEE